MAKLVNHAVINRFLRNNTDDSVLLRGESIYLVGLYELENLDRSGNGAATFRIKSASGENAYTITLGGFQAENPEALVSTCTCPYDWGGICKHRVAALLALAPLLSESAPPKTQTMLDTELALPEIADNRLQNNTPPEVWKQRSVVKTVRIFSAKDGTVEAEVTYRKEVFTIRMTRKPEGRLYTSCSCNAEQITPLCVHKLAVLLRLREVYGKRAFDTMNQDWTVEKNKLLATYGFSMEDTLKGKFDFKIDPASDKLQLLVLDPSIQPVHQDWQKMRRGWSVPPPALVVSGKSSPEIESRWVLLFSFDLISTALGLPGLSVAPLVAQENPKTGKLTHLKELRQGSLDDLPLIDRSDRDAIHLSQLFNYQKLADALRKAGLAGGYFYYVLPEQLSPEGIRFAQEWTGQYLDHFFDLLQGKRVFLNPDSYGHSLASMSAVILSPQRLKPFFKVLEADEFMAVEAFVRIGGEIIPLKNLRRPGNPWLLERGNTLYKLAAPADLDVLQPFAAAGAVRVRKTFFLPFFEQFIRPLAQQFEVDLGKLPQAQSRALTFAGGRVYLKEDDEHVLLIPAFAYEVPGEGAETDLIELPNDGRSTRVDFTNGALRQDRRDPAAEAEVLSFLRALHPDFAEQQHRNFFYLPFRKMAEGGWFLRFFEETKSRNIAVFGAKDLKKFKLNPHRAEIKSRVSSGIDWFDLRIEIQFGDQFASLADVRKALLNRQEYVPLADGSLGLLPQDWLDRYGQLLKFAEGKGDELRLSKRHFVLLDALGEIDDEKIRIELAEKKQKLLNFREIKSVPLPENIRATLRPYQVEGYKWLHFLHEFGWGGCLADDMGLGKTLQVITFLREVKTRRAGATSLVVVPTSLLFNWQAEVEKFCPDLRLIPHHGPERAKTAEALAGYDLVLTTYGTMRSDVELFRTILFEYIVLDESQAIKNPDSLAAKSARVLQARNRLVMTGTPVENNTFDLYSQMEFLNPGLLGSREFFRTEYANPIDKHQDATKAAELRRLIYPFLLKRTKEEVAKDLPDKTETILYCEMGKKQRKVYETLREHYRQRIAEEMALVGREKAAFLILEGLLKLRQVCDSPALLSGGGDYGNESAKLDELVREIEENASNHKILIFSQFLKMLDLVREHLEKQHIPYEYLDGQTTDRASRVNRFQTDQQCRVFLVSLKAGGVGLNLTEADYVYLVDPWWNPAVERQAIDRTHRIGQTRKVFAYRMICKDSVEEKILQLQERKKAVAADLISTEAGLLKSLTREDVMGLFS
ncbi:MAG: DEAD/DEAH box helicase [Cytophagaceae bacterium]|nr:DEAD/DEAH box helicase [Cytophagaceae bacterium]